MSLHLEFEPHSYYMGFAIKFTEMGRAYNQWTAYADDGNTYRVIKLEAYALKDLKHHIREYHLNARNGYGHRIAKRRLEYLRGEIESERISYGETAELRSLASYIENGDVQLLEWAGVREGARN